MSEEITFDDIEFGEPIEEREPDYRDGYIRGIYRAKNIIDSKQKEIERLNEKIDTLKIEISSLMSRYFYEEDFYIEDTHLDKLLRIIDNDIVLRGSDKE